MCTLMIATTALAQTPAGPPEFKTIDLSNQAPLLRHDCGQRDDAIPQVAEAEILVVGVLVVVEVRERYAHGRHLKSIDESVGGNAPTEGANAHQPFTITRPQRVGNETRFRDIGVRSPCAGPGRAGYDPGDPLMRGQRSCIRFCFILVILGASPRAVQTIAGRPNAPPPFRCTTICESDPFLHRRSWLAWTGGA
jgi:hypothetical protein